MILVWQTKIPTNLIGYRVLFKASRKRQQSILAGIPVLHTLYMTDLHYKSLIPTKMMEILRFSHTSIDPGLFLSRHRFQKHASPTTLSLDMLAMNVNSRLSFFSLQHRWKERIYVSTARTNFADERNSYRTTIFSGRDRCINRSRTKIQRTPWLSLANFNRLGHS